MRTGNSTVRQLLAGKGSDVFSISPDVSVREALKLMALRNVGALVVVENAALIGIISERDYARKVVLQGRSSKEAKVREIMSVDINCVGMEHTVSDCMGVMTHRKIRHLPVLGENGIEGIVSIGDVVKDLIAEQEFMLEQLENYITGTR